MNSRQIGIFSVCSSLVRSDPDAVRRALEGCVVVRAEAIWHRDVIEYVAIHDDFAQVPEGIVAPEYRCNLTKHADGSVSRSWQRAA